MQKNEQGQGHYLLLGDHVALDLLNTQAGTGDDLVEYWNAGADVIAWCRLNGIAPVRDSSLDDDAGLLAAAKKLRALSRALLAQKKDGSGGDCTQLNVYLHAHQSAPHVEVDADGKIRLARIASASAAAQMLGALAESVADLLCHGDFALVKQCEHPDCVLWFYDRTKAHRRRWCSMTLCGNRFKAAQFRKKAAATSA